MSERLTQKDRILEYLTYSDITSLEAVTELGIIDLRKCISDLRKDGWNIKDRWEKPKRKGAHPYKVYHLALLDGTGFEARERLHNGGETDVC